MAVVYFTALFLHSPRETAENYKSLWSGYTELKIYLSLAFSE